MKALFCIALLPLAGCASLINGIAPTDCYEIRSIAITVLDASGNVQIVKSAETIRVCLPAVMKVPPVAKAASAV